jgi:hypothetical protein
MTDITLRASLDASAPARSSPPRIAAVSASLSGRNLGAARGLSTAAARRSAMATNLFTSRRALSRFIVLSGTRFGTCFADQTLAWRPTDGRDDGGRGDAKAS